MALTREKTPKQASDKEFDPIPNLEEKEYDGRLVMVADLGMQEGMVWQGEQKPDRQQLALGIEIVGETITIDDKEVPRLLWTSPFNIFDKLTDKGKEIKFYSVFDNAAQDGDMPNWDQYLGSPCAVRVVHVQGKGDNATSTYDNIGALLAIPAKYQADVLPATIPLNSGGVGDNNTAVIESLFGLTKYVYDKRVLPSNVTALKPDQTFNDHDDDIPF